MYSFRLQQLGIKLVCLHHVVALSPLSGRDATSLNESPLQPHDGTGALRWEILANHVLPSRHFPPKSEFEFNPPSPIAIPPKFRATRRPVMSLRRFGDSFSRQRLRTTPACLLLRGCSVLIAERGSQQNGHYVFSISVFQFRGRV